MKLTCSKPALDPIRLLSKTVAKTVDTVPVSFDLLSRVPLAAISLPLYRPGIHEMESAVGKYSTHGGGRQYVYHIHGFALSSIAV